MSEIDEEIDRLANSVVHGTTGQVFSTTILAFSKLTSPQPSGLTQWRFDWRAEAKRKGESDQWLL
jgi:hypothetical protein